VDQAESVDFQKTGRVSCTGGGGIACGGRWRTFCIGWGIGLRFTAEVGDGFCCSGALFRLYRGGGAAGAGFASGIDDGGLWCWRAFFIGRLGNFEFGGQWRHWFFAGSETVVSV